MLTRMPAWGLSRNAAAELARALAVKTMGVETAEKLIVTEPEKKIVVPEGLDLATLSPRALELAKGAGTANYKIKPMAVKPPGIALGALDVPKPTAVTAQSSPMAE